MTPSKEEIAKKHRDKWVEGYGYVEGAIISAIDEYCENMFTEEDVLKLLNEIVIDNACGYTIKNSREYLQQFKQSKGK
jgi:hypothetical protein